MGRFWWSIGIFGCTSNPADTDESEPLPPNQPGEYAVGTWVTEVPGPNGITLPVQVWFPASETEGVPYEYMGLLPGLAYETATPACDTERPVVLYSHGNQAFRYVAFSSAEWLASHGFVVIAPDHVRNTFFDLDEEYWHGIVLRRPLDIMAAYDGIFAAPGPLAGCMEEGTYQLMGHSMGGMTAFALAGAPYDMAALEVDCQEQATEGCDEVRSWRQAHPGEDWLLESDPRVSSVFALTPAWPWVFGEDGLSAVNVPKLVVGGNIDTRTPWDDMVYPSYVALSAPKWLVGVEGAGHYSFTDFCPVIGPSFNGCGDDATPVEDVLAIADTLSVAWARHQRGEEDLEIWLSPEAGVFVTASDPD